MLFRKSDGIVWQTEGRRLISKPKIRSFYLCRIYQFGMHNLKLLVIEFDTFDCSIIFQGCSIQIPTQGDKLTFRFISSGIITWCPKKRLLQEMLFLLLFLACEQHCWVPLFFLKHLPTCHMLLLKTFQNEFLFVFIFLLSLLN